MLVGVGKGEGERRGGGAPEVAKNERGCETPRVGDGGGVLGETLGPVGLRPSSTSNDDDEEEEEEAGGGKRGGASSLEGSELSSPLELGNELMLSKLLVGLHRRVKLKRKNCFPLTPMSPQQRDSDSKLLG